MLGRGEASAAYDAVERSLQTQKDVSLPDVGHDYGGLFDELYDVLHGNQQILPAFYARLVETDNRITQDINAILA